MLSCGICEEPAYLPYHSLLKCCTGLQFSYQSLKRISNLTPELQNLHVLLFLNFDAQIILQVVSSYFFVSQIYDVSATELEEAASDSAGTLLS